MKLFNKKPKCYGRIKISSECDKCKYNDKCRETTNKRICGTFVKYTDKPYPKPPIKHPVSKHDVCELMVAQVPNTLKQECSDISISISEFLVSANKEKIISDSKHEELAMYLNKLYNIS